jgi:hypothetical protein
MIPTAEEFLKQQDCIRNVKDFFNDVQPIDLIEFAKLHVTEALKQAEEIAIEFDSEGNYDNSILNAYPLTNIK